MKNLLSNILGALLAGAAGIGYVVANLAIYAFTMSTQRERKQKESAPGSR